MQLFNPCGFLENLDKNDQPLKKKFVISIIMLYYHNNLDSVFLFSFN